MNFSASDFPFINTGKSLTINFKGLTRIIAATEDRYHKILACVKQNLWNDIPVLLDPASQVAVYSNGKIQVKLGEVFIDGVKASPRLSKRIISHMEKNEPYEPLVNFHQRLQQNSSYRSVNQLFDFLEANHFALHLDGRFLAYKGVTNEYKDIHTGTFDNSPGSTPSVLRNTVDEDPDKTCSYGLHVAAYSYAKDFAAGRKIIEVLVDPKDVVAVPIDHNNAKMRVCQYLVLGDAERGERQENVYAP